MVSALKIITTLAWRNLWRNKRRTTIMLGAIGIGVWAMIFMTALMRGMVEDMLARGLDKLPGHVQVHQTHYLDDPSVVNSFSEPYGPFQQQLDDTSKLWYGRVKVPAVISSERETRGVKLLGINPSLEEAVILRNAKIIQGRFLDSANDAGIVIGQKLLQRLESNLNRRVVITSQDPSNNLAEQGFRIIGVYKAEFTSEEEVNVYGGRNTIQNLLNIPGEISEIAVFSEDYRNISSVYSALKNAKSAEHLEEFDVKTWMQVDGYLSSMMKMMDGFVLVWIVVIFLTLSFGLANTLVMAVYERVREIGLMLALGMRPTLIMSQILSESIFLLLIGLLIGNTLALASVAVTSDGIDVSAMAEGMEMAGAGTVLYPALFLKDLLLANFVVIALGILTSILPAWRASKYDPIRALAKVY